MAETRGKGRPKLTEAAEIDRAIHEAALQVLLEHGQAATMNAVALAAGLSRKTVYARYPNKTELFVDSIGSLLKAVDGLQYDTGGAAEDRLRQYIVAALTVISLPQSLAVQRLLTMDPAYIAVLRPEMLGATKKIFFDPLVTLLGEAHESGEFVIENVEQTARAIIRLIFAESAAMDGDGRRIALPPYAGYAEFLTHLITKGLLSRP